MKRFLIILGLLSLGLCANAEYIYIETNSTAPDFWEKGTRETKEIQKVVEVGTKIVNANKLERRVPFQVVKDSKTINAGAFLRPKLVVIYTGTFPYIENDHELAYILSHEIAHTIDAYDGLGKWTSMKFNTRSYEYKADLIGVDLMVKAGYNPLAAIIEINKWMPEPMFDFFNVHPKASKRMFEIYKYVYKKYPWALNTEMAKNVNYINFLNSSQKEIAQFLLDEKNRENSRKNKYSL